jgi:hypothetical protein
MIPLILIPSMPLRMPLLGASSILDNQLIERVVLVPVYLCIANMLGRFIHDCILKRWLKSVSLNGPILIAFSKSPRRRPIVYISPIMLNSAVRVAAVIILEVIPQSGLSRSLVFYICGNIRLLLRRFTPRLIMNLWYLLFFHLVHSE